MDGRPASFGPHRAYDAPTMPSPGARGVDTDQITRLREGNCTKTSSAAKRMGTIDNGHPPKCGWAKLVSELLVEDINASRAFWLDLLGFEIAYQRPEEGFVYLERPEGAQIMPSQRSGKWETADLLHPFGRGVMFQMMWSLSGSGYWRRAGRSMPARVRSGAAGGIERAASARSSFLTRTAIWSCSRRIWVNGPSIPDR